MRGPSRAFCRTLLVSELAVIGDNSIDHVEIDAPATALRRAQLEEPPIHGLIVGVVERPGGWGAEPAQFGQSVVLQNIADEPAAVDANAVAALRQRTVDFPEVG